jgi:hypothetical protein
MIKIRYYLKDLRDAKGIFDECISAVESRIIESSTSASTTQQFLEWFGHIFAIKDLPVNPEPEVLIRYIQWAQKAKSHYLDFLKAAFSGKVQPYPDGFIRFSSWDGMVLLPERSFNSLMSFLLFSTL